MRRSPINGLAGAAPSFRFERREHLRDGIREVFNRGKSRGCKGAKLFVVENGLDYNRMCFALPRKFGNAVERNRARRLSREAYRHVRPRLKSGYDAVLLVYPEGEAKNPRARANFADRMEQVLFLFAKAGLMRE
jgi:ribonuclease P protein component